MQNNRSTYKLWFIVFQCILVNLFVNQRTIGQNYTDMAFITGGPFMPLYGQDTNNNIIDHFYMDIYPVTNADFQGFVKAYPEWKKSNVKRIFADANYLLNWINDSALNVNIVTKNSPVTYVSWFAAKAYCECQGKRLPTVNEWEYAAAANEKISDARKSEAYNKYILSWYEQPRKIRNEVGSTFKNYWGVYDLHGLVWEWTYDFNSVLISGESRKDVDNDFSQFCGSASVGANDLMDYSAFMRYATRGSLKAAFTMNYLGFRCVKNQNNEKKTTK